MKRTPIVIALLFATAPALVADTLVLTNGRRVQGELVGVFGRDIEFEERDGSRGRTVRIPKRDIARIEFDASDDRDTRGDRGNRGDRGDRADVKPRGLRERQVQVNAREQWTDTGVDVRAGQQVFFVADGEVRWGPNRRDGAAGEKNSPVNNGRPLPDRPAAALIGRIGNDVFFIGDDVAAFRLRSGGRLFLGINDDVLTDNSGTLRVVVSY
jgi:hypothetical protein